jgi:hypothetical protein
MLEANINTVTATSQSTTESNFADKKFTSLLTKQQIAKYLVSTLNKIRNISI